MGGRLDDRNLDDEDMRARSKGDWGKTAPTMIFFILNHFSN
jgi:hypothetical protein